MPTSTALLHFLNPSQKVWVWWLRRHGLSLTTVKDLVTRLGSLRSVGTHSKEDSLGMRNLLSFEETNNLVGTWIGFGGEKALGFEGSTPVNIMRLGLYGVVVVLRMW